MMDSLVYVLHYGPYLCQSHLPLSSIYAPLYSALVCGSALKAGQDSQLFLDTGLIHLLVVSGAHLMFLERWLRWLPERLRLLPLGLYAWLCGFNPPVVRAWVRRWLLLFLQPCGWSALQVEAATTVTLLCLWPPWLGSRSFLMSWLCAMAMQAPLHTPRWPQLGISLRCYLFLLPLTWASPIGVLWNATLAPLMGELLLPTCMLAMTFSPLVGISDFLWRVLLALLKWGPQAPPSLWFWPSVWLWWLPLLVHTLLLWGEWKWRRERAFSW